MLGRIGRACANLLLRQKLQEIHVRVESHPLDVPQLQRYEARLGAGIVLDGRSPPVLLDAILEQARVRAPQSNAFYIPKVFW